MNKHLYLKLILLSTVLILFMMYNNDIPITDPVEGNYALTAKEMLMSGDWLSPKIYGHYWFDKPVMFYWLIALSYKIFGVSQFAARFPSAVFSTISIVLIYWFSKKLFQSRQTAYFSAIILATSLEFWILGKMVITDSVLFFFNSAAVAFFYLGISFQTSYYVFFGYIFCGVAVLTKGPVGIVLPGIIVCVYILLKQDWLIIRRILNLPGIIAFFAVALPWNIFMYNIHGQIFLDTFWGLHNYVRATISEHPQDNVWYYYILLFIVSLLPWTGIFLKAVYSGLHEFKTLKHFAYMFVWIIVTIGFYTLMATKYPTYIFPAIFPAAIISARYLEKIIYNKKKYWSWLAIPTIAYFLIIYFCIEFFVKNVCWDFLYLIIFFSIIIIINLYFFNKYKYFPQFIAAMTFFISIILISKGFTKYANEKSMANIASYITNKESLIGFYKGYSTTAVFYTDIKIFKIIDVISEPNIQDIWSKKYTMPTILLTEFLQLAQQKETYILTKENDYEIRKNFYLNYLQLIYSDENISIYKIINKKI